MGKFDKQGCFLNTQNKYLGTGGYFENGWRGPSFIIPDFWVFWTSKYPVIWCY